MWYALEALFETRSVTAPGIYKLGHLSWEAGRSLASEPLLAQPLVLTDEGDPRDLPDILRNPGALPVWSEALIDALRSAAPLEAELFPVEVTGSGRLRTDYRAVNLLPVVRDAVDWEASDVDLRPDWKLKWIDSIRTLVLREEALPRVAALRVREYRSLVLVPEPAARVCAALNGITLTPLPQVRRNV